MRRYTTCRRTASRHNVVAQVILDRAAGASQKAGGIGGGNGTHLEGVEIKTIGVCGIIVRHGNILLGIVREGNTGIYFGVIAVQVVNRFQVIAIVVRVRGSVQSCHCRRCRSPRARPSRCLGSG